MTTKDDCAYPTLEQTGNPEAWNTYVGLTKREYFAAMAMQGLLVNYITHGDYANDNWPDVSKKAVMAADSLIEELNK